MTLPGRPAASSLSRRKILIALGLAPAAAALAACGKDGLTESPRAMTGPDLSGGDPGVGPARDLYRSVNGAWLRDYQLPPDRVSYGTFDEVNDRVEEQLRAIVEGIEDPEQGSAAQQIRDLYDAWMDTDAIEKLGLTPVSELLARIDAAPGKAELAGVLGGLPIGALIGIGVTADSKKSTATIASVGQSGLGLPEQYYRKPEYADKVSGYRAYLGRIATAAGFADPGGTAARVVELETRIAAGFWDNVRLRDPEATYNKLRWDEMVALAPQFEWDQWLAGATDRPRNLFDSVIVEQPSYLTHAGTVWQDTDLGMWKDYLKLSVLNKFARFLPASFHDPYFDFFVKDLQGMAKPRERWRDGLDVVTGEVGEQLGKLYVAQHFPPDAKKRALEMVADLMAAYRDDFRGSTWMSQPTRDAALAKLEKIDTKIGYPDKWQDFSGLKITRGKLLESVLAAEMFHTRRDFDKLGKPVDKSEWGMSPQTVNAYYNPVNNEIVFPAAFLQPPFFDPDAIAAVNYAAVGAVIGHEIGHGFDDQGSQYDGNGNLHDWWTPADRAAFKSRTDKVVAQYSALVPEGCRPEQRVNGELTLGENVADIHGLQMALAAYAIAEQRRGVETPDYKPMFEAWARTWRTKATTEYVQMQIAEDPHSPAEFRANQVVRNLPEFYTTFQVRQSDPMYLPEDQRVVF
ncbi:M13 family metallopeptidase [Nocardia jejuensis]|uniref:M13 family metallopeptidase n=1 Tax=Nocardia jejuensis TaxID=328049 RepID=UPI000A8FFF5D|nr:M13 family metallopeptidase [Nocardia jejuensis]